MPRPSETMLRPVGKFQVPVNTRGRRCVAQQYSSTNRHGTPLLVRQWSLFCFEMRTLNPFVELSRSMFKDRSSPSGCDSKCLECLGAS